MMVMKETSARICQPRNAQNEPEKLRPSGWPLEARLATNQRRNSQYSTM